MSGISKHREMCNNVLNGLIESRSSSVISTEKYNRIRHHLQNPSDKIDSRFKFWINKEKRFYLISVPALNAVDMVVKHNPAPEDGAPNYLQVVHSEQIYDVVEKVHNQELIHAGYRKVLEVIKRQYDGITRSYVQYFCTNCPICQLRQPQKTKPLLKPIIESSFNARVQIDLIDMRRSPDDGYQYICHGYHGYHKSCTL